VLRNPAVRRLLTAGCALALATAPAAAQLSTFFGKNKIQYREFDWQIYNSPHFEVYYYSDAEPLLEKVVSFAESAYDRLSREFDHQIQEPIPLIYYATHSAFEQNNIILNFIPEGVGAFATPVRNRMVLPVDLPDGELFELVMHELTHIFQYSVIFRGRMGRSIAGQAPQWFMEGMASYMAKDEGTIEKMYLRDAVVNDAIPPIAQRGAGGYLAYRFGHAAFEYIEERWGKEGFRDFVYEFRNTIGGRADRALERALRISPEDFDLDFRRWLRRRYVPELAATGEPSDFGRPFRDESGDIRQAISPTASPSGDLVAAIAVARGDLDVYLFDTRRRRPVANLTRGFSRDYQYAVSQFLTSKPRMGRDLAFSPDGNRLALFVKREAGRSLMLIDVVGRRVERILDMDVEQQHAPAWSPDGRRIAFSGNRAGRFDIFILDLASGEIVNLTDDEGYDGAPVYTPDGTGIVYSSTVGYDHAQLFRIDLADPAKRERLTEGPWSDRDAIFSSDGQWIYFTSDRTGIDNIWALELATGRTLQHTNVVTGCFMPTVLRREDGRDRLVYAGLWRGSFDLYLSDLDEPIVPAEDAVAPAGPGARESLEAFEPDILATIDDANRSAYRPKLFLEDAGGAAGITDDQLFVGQAYFSFSDYLGDRRLFVLLNSVDTFSDFSISYVDRSRRWNWGVQLFDDRSYFVGYTSLFGGRIERRSVFRQTGVIASWIYPFSFYTRVEAGGGFVWREYDFQQVLFDADRNPVLVIEPRTDNFPLVQAALVGDSAVFDDSGPLMGRRWRLRGSYGHDTSGGGALAAGGDLDFRQYLRLTQRSSLAFRAFGGYSEGSFPSIYPIGGLDTLRGIPFRSLVGDRAYYSNLELRFPLIDALVGPALDFRRIRGRIFVDVGGAWRDYAGEKQEFCDAEEGITLRSFPRTANACAAYGWGFSVPLGPFDLNWDFAQAWDFKDRIDGGFKTTFWIGSRF
jgi:hypothetical protein